MASGVGLVHTIHVQDQVDDPSDSLGTTLYAELLASVDGISGVTVMVWKSVDGGFVTVMVMVVVPGDKTGAVVEELGTLMMTIVAPRVSVYIPGGIVR